jgi:tetratricopeptide (TPR) repeat protein
MLDSRAFAELKLKLYDASIADYDEALKLRPTQAASLYGRGLAKRANGNPVGGDADIKAALEAYADIAKDFEKWGMTP